MQIYDKFSFDEKNRIFFVFLTKIFCVKQKLKDLSNSIFKDTLQTRRYLHQHPELSFKEFETTAYLINEIKQLGLPIITKYAKTGLVTKIEGKNPEKKSILLRADIDALPIFEKTETPYKSLNQGVMHACGHDVHTASLLSAIKILQQIKSDFEGTVWCIFQPAEEELPGGAKQMIDNGLLDDIKPSVAIGQHTIPNIEAGKIGVRAGNYMASTDEIYITLKGNGGHAALPHEITDTVLLASQLIVNLQQIVSRFIPASIPAVLSFGKIIANGATNIIPSEVKIEGIIRIMSEKWRKKVHEKIKEIIQSTVNSFDASFDLEIRHGYPVLYNDPKATTIFKEQAIDFMGKEQVLDLDIRMTAEDFAYFSHQVPVVYYRLGTGNVSKNITNPLHSPLFDVDEEVLRFAPGLLANTALTFLK